MKIFGLNFGKKRNKTQENQENQGKFASKISIDESWLGSYSNNASGVHIDDDISKTIAAVYACNRILCDTISSVPFVLYKKLPDGGRREAVEHALYDLLKYEPNEDEDSMEFRWNLQQDLNFAGKCYVRLTVDNAGGVREMRRLNPRKVKELTNDKGQKAYEYNHGDGKKEVIRKNEIWRTTLIGGLSPIDLHAENFGIAIHHQRHEANFFKNGGKFGTIITPTGKLTAQAGKDLLSAIERKTKGDGAFSTLVLGEEVKIEKIGITNEQAQFLQTIKAKKKDIAAIFNVPLHMIQEHEGATFSNIEQKTQDFLTLCARPLAVRLEMSFLHSVFTRKERQKYKAEINLDALLRADFLTRQQGLSMQRQNGIITVNEWRNYENLNPIAGGDTRLEPLNMIRIDEKGKEMIPQGTGGTGTDGVPATSGSGAQREPSAEADPPEVR